MMDKQPTPEFERLYANDQHTKQHVANVMLTGDLVGVHWQMEDLLRELVEQRVIPADYLASARALLIQADYIRREQEKLIRG